jgi:hypothetical protein
MINIEVDEGYAFDYLSILEVKKNLYPSETKFSTYNKCANFLKNQLGHELFNQVLSSNEYIDLYNSNKKTFNLVDLARKNGPVTAKEVDDANMERFFCKQKLQNSFFNGNLAEEKIV